VKLSFNRRRSLELHSLPPQRARSPKLVIIAGLLLSATVALAASRIGRNAEPVEDAAAPSAPAAEAEHRTERLIDERVRLHLRALH
jgi:hypothetical protein